MSETALLDISLLQSVLNPIVDDKFLILSYPLNICMLMCTENNLSDTALY